MRVVGLAIYILLLAGCPKSGDNKPPRPPEPGPGVIRDPATVANDGGLATSLPPAPPLPEVPVGLPARPPLGDITPDRVVLGELLFFEPRLSASGKTSCATCHAPARGWAGHKGQLTDDGKATLRRAPTIVNLAWATELGWDGRFPNVGELVSPHVKGHLGLDLETIATRLVAIPAYRAHVDRIGGAPRDAVRDALAAYVLTRYDGDSPWDHLEPSARAPKPGATVDPIVAGYLVFTSAGQCAVCHPPPLYTDHGFHRVYLGRYDDPGRGAVDPARRGELKTPTLRGATRRSSFMHDGGLVSLTAVVDHYLRAASTIDDLHVDATLTKIQLSPQDRTHLLAFLEALSSNRPPPPGPALP